MVDYKSIELKWQNRWAEEGLFEPETGSKKPYMVVAAFPYVNGPQHIGHLRTFGTADVLARYKRMRGFAVLYPMGFHCTGTPILAMAKRIKSRDKELIDDLKRFHIKEEDIARMEDPDFMAFYFAREIEGGMRRAGFGIDWRRKFFTVDQSFSKFIEWQFGILNSKGYLIKGSHPLGWCMNENNAVGMHDTKHDVEPDIEKETAIRFRVSGEDAYMVCVTFRPETIFGVTNIFISQNAKYVLCRFKDFSAYISADSAKMLAAQTSIEEIREVDGTELLKKTCVNPVNGEVLPVLPGFFVKPEIGTGVVMSVPSHAPFDYAALERLKRSGYPVPEMKIRKLIDVDIGRSLSDVAVGQAKPSQIDIPALAYLEILHADAGAIDDMLEFATKLEYREESHWGKMSVKGYEGMSEPKARDLIRDSLEKQGDAFGIYVIANSPVYCRCGHEIVVKVVGDQWFINYGDKAWKGQAMECMEGMSILPDKLRKTFETAFEWIDRRAVARSQGLGTRFPLDSNFIIESLSDSTLYMAFYTISSYIREMEPEKLRPEFFDYVFLGKGDAGKISESTGIDYDIIKRCRESFAYWYVALSNHSGPDLIFNHLTMYTYNHVAVFGKEYWPRQTVVNGVVLSEGEKMSKSLGNIIPLAEGLEQHGVDPMRIAIVAGAELYSDSEFSLKGVNGIKDRIEYIYGIADRMDEYEPSGLSGIDYWLYSKLNRKIRSCTEAMERLSLRDASVEALYNSVIELKEYTERGGKNQVVIKDYLHAMVLMMQPIAPHISEDLWHKLGNSTFAATEAWPVFDEGMIDDLVERKHSLADSCIADARNAMALMSRKEGAKAKLVRFIVANSLKRSVNNELARSRKPGEVIAKFKADGADSAAVADYVGRLSKRMNELSVAELTDEDEISALADSKEYMEKELGCVVEIEKENESKSQRAARAMPMKPCIDLSA